MTLGVALVPRWTSRMAVKGVRYVPLEAAAREGSSRLPLAAAWMRDVRDPVREELIATVREHLAAYAKQA